MHNHKEEHYQQGKKATLVSLLLNTVLSILKFIAGMLGHSQAMVADAAHSFSDLISDITVLIGLKIAHKPKDATHPYGHGKVETLVGFGVGVLLIIIGVEIFHEACTTIGKTREIPGTIALWAAVFSILLKEFLYQYNAFIGRKMNSPAVIANAWHHRSDALSSVAAFIGIGAARLGYPWMDQVAAILVGILIIKVAGQIIWSTGRELSEERIDPKMINKIKDIVKNIKGVKSMHKLRTRKSGMDIIIDLHIQVDPKLSVEQGHKIAKDVKTILMKELEHVESALVHVEPFYKK